VIWPTARFWTSLKVDVTTKFTIQRNICYTSDCQLQLLHSWWWARWVPKHVEWSCNKTKILLLYLVGYLYTYPTKCLIIHRVLRIRTGYTNQSTLNKEEVQSTSPVTITQSGRKLELKVSKFFISAIRAASVRLCSIQSRLFREKNFNGIPSGCHCTVNVTFVYSLRESNRGRPDNARSTDLTFCRIKLTWITVTITVRNAQYTLRLGYTE
jgi:hypothetical protein